MATSRINPVLHHLRRAVLRRDGGGLADGELLDRFLADRDEAAFAALVRRHGAMVLGVCRRLLGNLHDAEDAFQATFLVLARKAGSVRPRSQVGNWLYGVAYQTAVRVRSTNARRYRRERQVTEMPEPQAVPRETWDELLPILDQELARLPDKYRVPIVLCDLEGKTRKEAAQQLGWPEGTMSSRLARARSQLARRLACHGLALSGGALAVVLSENAASACASAALVTVTARAACQFVAGPVAAGVISVEVAALTEGVLKTMLVTKLKSAMALLLAVGLLGAGIGATGLMAQTPAASGAGSKSASAADGKHPSVPNVEDRKRQLQLEMKILEMKLELVEKDRQIDQLRERSKLWEGSLKNSNRTIEELKIQLRAHAYRADMNQCYRCHLELKGPVDPWHAHGQHAGDSSYDLLEAARLRAKIEEQRKNQDVKDAAAKEATRNIQKLLLETEQHTGNPQVSLELLEQIEQAIKEMKEAKRKETPKAKPVWNLDFRFKDPQLVMVEVPAQGQKPVWYLRYEVINHTNEARTFLPDFEMVIGDRVSYDKVLPKVHEAIRRIEDPKQTHGIKNSITIAGSPIPPSQRGGEARGVVGVAIWDDLPPDGKTCTLFIGGLTNAWTAGGDSVHRKVLKIEFKRVGNAMQVAGPTEWVFRETSLKVTDRGGLPHSELEKAIQEMAEAINLDSDPKALQFERDLYRHRLQDLERELATGKFDKNELARMESQRDIVKRRLSVLEHLGSKREEMLESYLQRLDKLRRPLRQSVDRPHQSPSSEQEKRLIEIENVRKTIGILQAECKEWQKEQAHLRTLRDSQKRFLEQRPRNEDSGRRKEMEAILKALERQLQAGEVEDQKRQTELQLIEPKLKVLEAGDGAPPEKPKQGNQNRPAFRGTVQEVTDSNLLRLSIGADHGVQKGDQVEIYRLEPKPVYLGSAQVLAVQAQSSVARMTRALSGRSPQVGDQASSELRWKAPRETAAPARVDDLSFRAR